MRHCIIFALILLSAASAFAAGNFDLPPGKWWERPHIVRHLELTKEQQEAIRAVVVDHARRMIDLNAGVERTKLDLAQQVDREPIDAAAVRGAFKAFQEARKRLELERFEMILSVRQTMSSEQWQKVGELIERLEGMQRRRDRPGLNPPPAGRSPGAQRPSGPGRRF